MTAVVVIVGTLAILAVAALTALALAVLHAPIEPPDLSRLDEWDGLRDFERTRAALARATGHDGGAP